MYKTHKLPFYLHCSQNSPRYPDEHSQKGPLMPGIQRAPFLQGFSSQTLGSATLKAIIVNFIYFYTVNRILLFGNNFILLHFIFYLYAIQ